MTVAAPVLAAVLPADVDDPQRPSGGNVYDRRVLARLAGVQEIAASGTWPAPSPGDRAALAASLAALPDGAVVLLDGLVACGVPEVVVPEAGRLRLVVLVHLPLADEAGADPALAERERAVLRSAAAVVATSAWSAGRLAALHGLAAVPVVTPGADPAPLAPGTDGTSLLCVGSVTPTKGQDLLVGALARVAARSWRCRLVGPLGRAPGHVSLVRRELEKHGLADRVRLDGPLTGAALDEAYGAADLLVLPSRAEAFGMVVLEALARGIPVLATDVGGVREALGATLSGEMPGLLVAPHADALAAALRDWLDDPALRTRLRGAAHERRRTVPDWAASATALAAILEGVRS
ncbi:glycosyltransferase family 4 protein [Pseudonocardia sp. RS11V-5]|uniref:glycosyltransferase family 4 protein n=1 Tax=Pseudonocardia terrae TaxID=2905831 RepID=UPI001E5725B4|nr:glycosyltransferase family 4 protein [Pseudonocardia terrae]MCE3551617.1 glycosyltransferase family 4 protein [Pseudonocardia terrae]